MIFRQIAEIRDGRKTQTRRMRKPNHGSSGRADGTELTITEAAGNSVGKSYAIVPKRGHKAIPDGRIRITRIRCERVQDITEADARAEGVDVGRPGPELEKWLRAHRAGLSAARKGYMEESVPSPLKLLNGLLNDLRENPRTDESYGALRELNLKGLRLIIFDEERDPRYDTALVGKLLRVHQRLERAGLGAVWYGTVLYVSRKDGTLTGKDLEEARAAGYDLKSYAGVYNASRDQIKIHGYPDEAARTLAHELGHRYWFRFLKREDRLRYQEAVRTAPLKFDSEEARQKYLDDMDYFPGETDEAGQEKPLVPVSSYGATNAHEAFAEAFMYYVMGMGMSAEARAAFRQVVGLR